MKVYISGGCKNGKSKYAENLTVKLSGSQNRYYIATMIPHDREDEERIKRHVSGRKHLNFTTIECPYADFEKIYELSSTGAFLFDSVTALLSNEMFKDGAADENAKYKTASRLLELCGRVDNIVFVSDYIYSDALTYDEITEMYRRGLSFVDRKVSSACDYVIEMNAGTPIIHKSPGKQRMF